ncbi:MAG: cytochrome c4 [Gammaproteobacteria bacterium]|nr:cytochrome c4 [Gammaproteobacteria bacterium]MDH5650483.1 cytochrome c4 [Gammaproteobacteria bacterium]
MSLNKTVIISIALLIAGSVQAAGDAAKGEGKAAVCAGCHGQGGNSTTPATPKLAGQGEAYIIKQLEDFKSGARDEPTMKSFASGLSKQDMADVAAYFAGQKTSPGSANKDLVTHGQNIYRGGNGGTGVAACMACHGPSGSGNPPAKYPQLSGQHAAYVEKTMKDFQSGKRANDANKIMRDIAIRMTEAEIKAVASYIAGLH